MERMRPIVSFIADVVWTMVVQKQTDDHMRRLNSQLERIAMTDELTGLANRRSFFIQGKEEIKRAKRFGTLLAMIMVDIDHFKAINDGFGHETGDTLLRNIAKIFQLNIREVDVTARLGGEEFGILLPNTNPEAAVVLAERLRATIEMENEYLRDREIHHITASIGVATLDPGTKNLDTLMRNADRRCVGRNT
jgi:diguanylate cyclase (GGDEF)-like protein